LRYPVIASPKLDGVRAVFISGSLVTRSLKPIPNREIQRVFKYDQNLDGELIVGEPTDKEVFRNTMKIVSAFDAPIHDVRFHVFDLVYSGQFAQRLQTAYNLIQGHELFVPVPHMEIKNERELLAYEDACLSAGFEGVMIRDPLGYYKYGRSTQREGSLLKLKRKCQSEAVVVGFEEQMHNANEQKINALGYAERSSHQENKIPTGVLGALIVKDVKTGVEFNIGTGFNFLERQEIWEKQPAYRGRTVSYEYLGYGVKDKPRHPVYLGWRMLEDQS
jgi:DNA ligase-1